MPLGDTLRVLLVVVLFGLNFPISKIGVTEIPSLTFVLLRFVLVALLLVPLRPLPRHAIGRIALLSVTLGLIHFSLMLIGLRYVDSSVAAIAVQSQVPFSALLAAIFLKDRLGWRRTLGMAIAIGGVVILAGTPTETSPFWALAMVLGAAFMWSVANIQMKLMPDVDHITLNGWMALLTVPQLLVASLIFEDGQIGSVLAASWAALGAVVFNAVVVVIFCYAIWLGLLRRHSVNLVMPWTLLVPVTGVLSSILLLGEPFTWNRLVGGIATLVGVGIIVLRRPRLIEQRTSPT